MSRLNSHPSKCGSHTQEGFERRAWLPGTPPWSCPCPACSGPKSESVGAMDVHMMQPGAESRAKRHMTEAASHQPGAKLACSAQWPRPAGERGGEMCSSKVLSSRGFQSAKAGAPGQACATLFTCCSHLGTCSYRTPSSASPELKGADIQLP